MGCCEEEERFASLRKAGACWVAGWVAGCGWLGEQKRHIAQTFHDGWPKRAGNSRKT
jgi:hypothetical protein